MKLEQDYIIYDGDDTDELAWVDAIDDVEDFFPQGYRVAVLCCTLDAKDHSKVHSGEVYSVINFRDLLYYYSDGGIYGIKIGISTSGTLFIEYAGNGWSNRDEIHVLTRAGYDVTVGQYLDSVKPSYIFEGVSDADKYTRLWNSRHYSHPIKPEWLKRGRRIHSVA